MPKPPVNSFARATLVALFIPAVIGRSECVGQSAKTMKWEAPERFPSVATPGIRFNKTIEIACHNCYDSHQTGGPRLQEALGTIWDLELDLLPQPPAGGNPLSDHRWAVSHLSSPIVNDCGSVMPSSDGLHTCLQIIEEWHRNHPSHPVLTVFLDLKAGWDTTHTPAGLDSILTSVVDKSSIYRPFNLRGKFSSVREAIRHDAWPLTDELRGKIIFVLTAADGLKFDPPWLSRYVHEQNAASVAFVAPQGIERRLFTMHPDGFSKYFTDKDKEWVAFRGLGVGTGFADFARNSIRRGMIVRVWWPDDIFIPTVCQMAKFGIQRLARLRGWSKPIC